MARRAVDTSAGSCRCWARRRGSRTAPPTSTRRCAGSSSCSCRRRRRRVDRRDRSRRHGPAARCPLRRAGRPRSSRAGSCGAARPARAALPHDALAARRGPTARRAHRALRDAMIHDEEDRRHMDLSGLRWTMALPLAPSGGPLGSLGLGVGPRAAGSASPTSVRRAARRPRGPRARQRPARPPADRRAAPARRHPRLARRGRHGPGHQRPDGLREPGAARLLGLPDVHAVLTAPPASLADLFDIRYPDERPAASRSCPGTGSSRRDAAPLLTHSVYRATGELHWFLTKATPLVDETGERLAVKDRGRHRGAGGGAARALPRRGRPGAGVVARLRGDAAAASPGSPCRSSPTGARSSCRTSAAAGSRSRSPTRSRALRWPATLRDRSPPTRIAPAARAP